MVEDGQDAGEVGRAFVRALIAKDREAMTALLDPDVDFRGMTPSQDWRATDPAGVLEIVFDSWFEPHDLVRETISIETEPIADRHRLRYRLRVESTGESYVVDQQGYFDASDGLITRMSLMCSGFRPSGS